VDNTSGFFPNQTNGIVAIYTNWTPAEEAQAIAYSYDGGYTFFKYSGNPVISLKMHGFRDPKVIWYEKTRTWVMAVSHADAHFVEFYTSKNLTSWTKASTFSNPAIVGAFECPQFIPIPFRPTETPIDYYLLVISLGGGGRSGTSTVKYFPGTFNGTHFIPVDDLATRTFDFGPDFYATSFFYNLPVDANPVSISWAANLNYAGNTPTGPAEGWRSVMTVARAHYLTNTSSNGYDLVSEPYNIAPMYDRLLFSERRLGNGGLVLDYTTLDSGAVSLGLNFTTSSSASSAVVEICFTSSSTGENITLSLAMSSRSSDASSSTATFKVSRANISGWTSNLPLSTSSVVDLNPVASNASNGSRTYDVRGIMDRTILEAFVNGGIDAGTMIFFPSRRLDTIVLKIDALESEDFVDFEAWGLKSGWSASGNRESADKSNWKPKPEL
jgi:beta-fructofuranosidase